MEGEELESLDKARYMCKLWNLELPRKPSLIVCVQMKIIIIRCRLVVSNRGSDMMMPTIGPEREGRPGVVYRSNEPHQASSDRPTRYYYFLWKY